VNWSVKDFQIAKKRESPNVHYFGAAMARDFDGFLQQEDQKDRQQPDSLMDWVDQAKQSGKKVIYCSLGTVVGQEKWTLAGSQGDMVAGFYHNIFNFLGDNSEYVCVVSIGHNREVEDMGTIPSNFFVCQRVPQILLLTRTDVFITHCGNNGVHEALFCGTPMLCVPVFGDQHLNAETISRLKLGVQLASPFAPAPSANLDHVTASKLCEKLDELTHSDIRQACDTYKETMRKQHEYFHSVAFADMERHVQGTTRENHRP